MQISRPPLVKSIGWLRWAIPGSMALLGVLYTVANYLTTSSGSPTLAHILIGLFVLGFVGPALAWVALSRAFRAAEALQCAQDELEERNRQCAAMNSIARAVNSSLDLDEVLNIALDKIMAMITDVDIGEFRSVVDGRLVPQARQGLLLGQNGQGCSVRVGECLCGMAAAEGKLMLANDLSQLDRAPRWCIAQGFQSAIVLPVETKGQISGVIHLGRRPPRVFTPQDKRVLSTVGLQLGVAIEKAQLYSEVKGLNHRLQRRVEAQTVELEGAKDELADKARQLQQLLIEMIGLQEKERARIAYDMHDRAVQLIIGTLYQLQAARQCVAPDAEATGVLQTAQTMLKELEGEIREAIYDLRPPVLDSLGLVPALRHFAGRFRDLTGFPCTVSSFGPARRLPTETEIAIYRIVQEALHNVARHADASWAEVTLDFRGPNVVVTVSDDGRGFDAEAAHTQTVQHLGLISMRERALAIRGELRIMTRPGQGTRVVLTVPMKGL